jgi:YidC/Oxa1 family membrane protein insertase
MNKQDTQKRILLATLLSFAFFIAYDFLYVQPQQLQLEDAKKAQQLQTAKNIKTQAPQIVNKVKQSASNAPVVSDIATSEIITTITTKQNIIEIDSLGRIAQVTLLGKQYITEDGSKIKLFNKTQLRPLEIRFSNRSLNDEAFKVKVISSSKMLDATKNLVHLTLTQRLSTTNVIKNFTIYPDGHYDIDVNVPNGEEYFITPGFRPDVIADMYTVHGALWTLNDGTLKIEKDEKWDKTETITGIQITAAFDRYYATVLYNTSRSMQISVMPDSQSNPQIFIHGRNKVNLSGYIGPKEYKALNKIDPKLTQVVEYGWFTFIAKPMFKLLQYIHDYVGNWGWTIVLVTILIKTILYPLAFKGMVSMNRLKELAPKVKQIQEKYKDDKQKASMHMMELYKKEGANPMGGCLPVILQIPVFFAIYRVLLNAIELKGAQWIWWIEDLALMDPYYVLPILMGATMFIQQKITPNTMQDELQRKMFLALPVIFTFFFLWFPAGLTLYWFVNNLFTVGQQYYVNVIFARKKEQRHEKHLEEKAHKKGKK